jgi:hypothetical protein
MKGSFSVNDWVCGNCKSINRGAANACYSCRGAREIAAASAPVVPMTVQTASMASADGGVGVAALASPIDPGMMVGRAAAAPAQAAAPAEAVAPRQPADATNILGGFVGGLVAAALATAVWYGVVATTQYQIGLVAIAVGFIVGYGVVFGANRRGSVILVPISVIFTLLALVISEYLIVAHFVGQAMAEEGLTIELLQPPDVVISVVMESLQQDPLTLAFWAIALFQAFAIPSRAIRSNG